MGDLPLDFSTGSFVATCMPIPVESRCTWLSKIFFGCDTPVHHGAMHGITVRDNRPREGTSYLVVNGDHMRTNETLLGSWADKDCHDMITHGAQLFRRDQPPERGHLGRVRWVWGGVAAQVATQNRVAAAMFDAPTDLVILSRFLRARTLAARRREHFPVKSPRHRVTVIPEIVRVTTCPDKVGTSM